MKRRSLGGLLVWVVVGSNIWTSGPLAAQVGPRTETSRLLRRAAALEATGDLDGAARALREVLEREPSSSGALLGLERVYRAQGRVDELLGTVGTFLVRNPGAHAVRRLQVDVLLDLDSLDAARREADLWIAHEPERVATYRDLAMLYESALGLEAAREVLETGRDRIGDGPLALDIGDLHARAGELDRAVRAWSTGVGDDGSQVAGVARRLRALGPEGAPQVDALLGDLTESPVFARRRAAALIALELRMEDRAGRLSREIAAELGTRARSAFLAELGRRAEELRLPALAGWAYDELGEQAPSPVERRAFDQRLVEASLAAGDTAAAVSAQWRIADSFASASPDRRDAVARAIRLAAAVSPPGDVQEAVGDFVSEFPGSRELDRLAAEVSRALQAREALVEARRVLDGVEGPASALERGYLFLASGAVEEGRAALMQSLAGLPPAESTTTIRLVSLLGRMGDQVARVLARAAWEARRGAVEQAFELLERGLEEAAPATRADLLAHGARMAEDAGAADRAAQARTRLLEEHPDAAAVSEAALALARYHANRENEVQTAIDILEALIAERPDDPIVPNARLELSRLRGTP